MPQMAPLSWLFLFSLFSLTLILFSLMNYFLPVAQAPSKTTSSFGLTPLSWKW
uniref:ATP synthase complex subunit 8 n=1 Tax=Ameletus sp. 1 MT-2014 TaxID=1560007 RepID=A0A0A0RV21_9INSE|nr:ATP synthase F0 subunit 8 [Ameletus sp. 1 MT-2014]